MMSKGGNYIFPYKREVNESDEELIYRVCKDKESIGSWQDVANILNELLNTEYTESKFRKQFQSFERMLDANSGKFVDSDNKLKEITLAQRELKKERNKLRSEKVEYNRWLREESRDELLIEKIHDAITTLKPFDIPKNIVRHHEASPRGYCLAFGDEHYGAEFEIKDLFGNIINSYSPEIFEKRMWDLFTQTIEVIEKEKINVLNVFSLGDFSDGCLRVSQLMKLRCGVVDGTIQYAYFITKWLNELSKHVHVRFQMTDGNHTELRQLGQPKGTFKDDNMGKVVREFIKISMKDNNNFTFIENPTGYIYSQIVCNTVMGIHGEVKDMKRALSDFSSIYNVPIQYLFAGHMHHSKQEDVGINTEVINIPSIVGTDPYSLSISKVSNAAAKLIIFEPKKGKVCEYTLKL